MSFEFFVVLRYPLTCQQFEKNQTRVLCSIHLTSLTNQTPQFIQELPKTIRWFHIEYEPYDVTLFIIGTVQDMRRLSFFCKICTF
jgi:hypothetical protein